jgi:hypothetical protein
MVCIYEESQQRAVVASCLAVMSNRGASAHKVGLDAAFDVPTVGRIAVIQDPQGASLGIIQQLEKPSNCSGNQINRPNPASVRHSRRARSDAPYRHCPGLQP